MVAGRTAVLGAGMLGLTVAYRLTRQGRSVTVIEREHQAGGLAAGFKVAANADGSPIYLDKFYHHLFRADRAVIDLIDELGLSERMVWPSPASCILRDGEVYRMDGALPLLMLKPLPFVDRIRLGAVVAYLKAEKVYQRFERSTAQEWLTTWRARMRTTCLPSRCFDRSSASSATRSPCLGSGLGSTCEARRSVTCWEDSSYSTIPSYAR